MAHSVPRLLKAILSPYYKELVDPSGKPVVPSSDIYEKISAEISDPDQNIFISPKNIYTILQKNRYDTWTKVLEFHDIKIDDDSTFNDSQDRTLDNSKSTDQISFNLNIPYKTWSIMSPETVTYSDKEKSERRYTVLLRKVWTDTLYEKLWEQTAIPCPVSFKRCKISESGIYLKVTGRCTECESIFSGMVANKPAPRRDVIMECVLENFDPSISHRKKRQLKGEQRIDIATKMVDCNILPCIWRRNESDKLMKLGDPEPPHLPKNSVLRKAKQERHNAILGVTGVDPIENLRIMKYERHLGEIHSIGLDPFYVHYWTQEQVAVFIEYSQFICIDGTGSLVKKLKKPTGELCSHIYLYQIVTETPRSKLPVFQMLSASQNTNSIYYWLNEIIRICSKHTTKFPMPKQVVCDFDKALMGAIVRAFGECQDLKDYLSRCFRCLIGSSNALPSCFLRLDVSHYIHMISRWKELKTLHPLVRTFWIMVMAFLTKIRDFDEFQETVKSAIIVSNSETYGQHDDSFPCLAGEAFQRLRRIIRGDSDTAKLVETEGSTMQNEQEAQILGCDNDDSDETNNCKSEIVAWATGFVNESLREAERAQLAQKGDDVNPYYTPAIGRRIKSLLHYFPLFSGTMINIFGFGTPSATSSAVESEFDDLKHRLLRNEIRPMRIDKFVTTHLRSFSGRAKLAMAEQLNHDPMNIDRTSIENNSQARMKTPDSHLQDIQNCETFNSVETVKRTNELTLSNYELVKSEVIEPSANCSAESGVESPMKESHELTLEHNWRNKNGPKKIKRTYLDPHPELRVATSSKSQKVGINVLLNGNILESIKDKDRRIVVINTCGFDSIVQLLAAACTHDTFNEEIQTTSSEAFNFVKLFVEKGPCKQVYTERARLLAGVSCFVFEGKTPRVITVNADSNVCNLCEWIFKNDYSGDLCKECVQCKNVVTRCLVLVSLDFETISDHGYGKLAEAIDLNNIAVTDKLCSNCGGEVEVIINYHSHLFVECIGDIEVRVSIKTFPNTMILNGSTYTLVGIVHYYGSRNVKSIGHYTAIARFGDNWLEINDKNAKPQRITDDQMVNPVLCLYVRTF